MRLRPREAVLYLLLRLLRMLDRRPNSLKDLDPSKVRNILVVSSTAIGDTLMSTPAIRAVREGFARARIIALFNARNLELFENNPHVDDIVPYYGGYKHFWRTVWRLRQYRFDLALIFHGNEPQATPLVYLTGARFIIKLPNTSPYRFLLTNRDPIRSWDDFVHGVDQRLQMAELVGCRAADKRMVLPLATDQEPVVEQFLRTHGIKPTDALVGFQVAASTVSRMWFADKFIALGQRIVAAYPGVRIVITGSPPEAEYARKIAAAIGDKAIVAAGVFRLKQTPLLIRHFKLLVTGDTGIMHLAISIGTPVVALFAAVDASKSGPTYDHDKHTVIQKFRTCTPCVGKRCAFQICMDNISPDEVFAAVARHLQNPLSSHLKPPTHEPVEDRTHFPSPAGGRRWPAGPEEGRDRSVQGRNSRQPSVAVRSLPQGRGDFEVGVKRIVLLDTGKEWGGGTNSMLELLKRLDRNQYNVSCIFYNDYRQGQGPTISEKLARLGIDFQCLPQRPQARSVKVIKELVRLLFFFSKKLKRLGVFLVDYLARVRPDAHRIAALLKQQRAELLYLNNQPSSNLEGILAARDAGVPAIQHSRIDATLNPIETRLANRWLQKIICVSNGVRDELVKQGIDPAKCVVVHNGIDAQTTPRQTPAELRRHLGVEGALLIGVVGSLVRRKRIADLIEALAIVVKKKRKPVKCVIVGAGPEQSSLAAQTQSLGIADNVIFTGFQTDAISYINAFDIFALPSEKEGLPRVILEAMLMTKPVLACRVIGPTELVVHDETGFLLPLGGIPQWADALDRLIDDAMLRKKMGEAGRRRVLEHYSINKYVTGVSAVLDEVLASRAGNSP